MAQIISKDPLEVELFSLYKKDGNKSHRQKLVKSLTPLIRSQANKYSNSGLPYDALELEGRRLAGMAVDTYDPKMGTQLNTHVVNYLQKLSRFTTTYQNVGHIPEPRALMLGKFETLYSNLEDQLGREPTVMELSDAMQVPPREIERIQSERRNDLHMELAGAEDEGGFQYYITLDEGDPKLKDAVEFVYFDANGTDKKILEYTFGVGGVKKETAQMIKLKLGLTETELRKRKEDLAKKIKELL